MKPARAQRPLISVIVCAHNEEQYVDKCLPHLFKALDGLPSEIIFVADRCTDKTVEKARRYNVKIIEKKWKKWRNSYAESLQTGYLKAKGFLVSIVDVDIVVPSDFFQELTPMLKGGLASVAAGIVTYPDTLWNRIMSAWEKTYRLAPLGREPYGAARLVQKRVFEAIGGFRDVPTPDTDLDMRLAAKGFDSVAVSSVTVYHIRHVSLKSVISGQIVNGRGRYALGIGFMRSLAHAVFRLRPFLIAGWLFEWQRNFREKK